MDSQPPASFIPKKTFTASPARSGGGLLFFIAVFLFIGSLVAAGIAFGYEHYLQLSIANKTDSLQKNIAALNSSAVNDLIRLDSRMVQAKNLLSHHEAPSSIFAFLSQETLQNVQFTSFQYKLQTDGSAILELEGIADSFSTLALQSDQFGSSRLLKDIIFSNINTNQNGQVVFSLKTTVDPKLFLYANNITGTPITQPQTTSSTTSTLIPTIPSASSTVSQPTQ